MSRPVGAEVRPASDDQAAFLAQLIDAGLLLASGVPGVYGHSSVFEDIRGRLDARLSAEAAARGAERLRFPPVLPRRQLESSGYLTSFPHLAGSVFSFDGDEQQAAAQSERAAAHEDWAEFQQITELTLMPAACYPVYPAIAARGPLPPGGVFVDAGGAWVFRHEPSLDPMRRQIFHQHELVRIGEPEVVLQWRDEWAQRGLELLRALGLAAELDEERLGPLAVRRTPGLHHLLDGHPHRVQGPAELLDPRVGGVDHLGPGGGAVGGGGDRPARLGEGEGPA